MKVENNKTTNICFSPSKLIPAPITHPFEWYDDERPSAGYLGDNGDKLGVGGAEVAVVCVPRDLETVIAAIPSRRRAENVTEFGAPHTAE